MMQKAPGKLILLPTPIETTGALEPQAQNFLLTQCEDLTTAPTILVEDHKIARRRWLHWGLPRAMIDHFVLFNEHTEPQISPDLLAQLRQGKNMVVMSDCGLPGIFDPGQALISQCWKNGIRVTSMPFPNSTLLALALSGFPCAPHYLAGFLARDETGRQEALESLFKNFPCGITILDTPYRYGTMLSALSKLHQQHSTLTQGRELFVACDLNTPEQECHRLTFPDLANFCKRVQGQKREFILIIGPNS